MQHRDDSRQANGRPSLLSSQQQAEADRDRILGKLDGESEKRSARPKGRKGRWYLAAAAVSLACAGALAWVVVDGGIEDAMPAERAAVAPPPAPAQAPEPEVSAAVILDLAPAKAARGEPNKDTPEGPAAAAAEPADDAFKLVREASPAALAQERHGAPAPDPQPPHLVPTPRQKPLQGVKGISANKASVPAPVQKIAPPPTKKTAPRARTPLANEDNDVALLAALVAHSKRPSAAALKLKQCGPKGSAKAIECRARLCAGSARNEAACKALGQPAA
ncbi:MAG: hypothetical protein V4857_20330 [Pseudomonadota bacterium]